MVNFRQIFVVFALLGIFILAMVSFGSNIAVENNANQTILNDPTFGQTFSNLNESLKTFDTQSQQQRENFEGELPASEFVGTFIILSIIGAGKTFISMVVGIFNIIFSPFSSIIGINGVVLGVFVSIFTVIIVLAAWRLYKVGE